MPDGGSKHGLFDYILFGLTIRSELELPELIAGDCLGEPDIFIVAGEVPPEGEGIIAIPDIARFHVESGSRIVVDAELGAAPRNVRLYLLGSVMGLLLHKRGLMPLHASAVAVEGRAVAFMGPSGAGKSTLAARLHDLGLTVIADDVVVIRFDGEGRPLAMPGLPRLRLWKDALELSGRHPSGFARSYAGDDDWEKYDVPLTRPESDQGMELAALYLLAEGDTLDIAPLSGLATAEAVFANTYRGAFVTEAGDARAHWQSCLSLVQRVPVFSFTRVRGFERIDAQVEELLAHARRLIASG